MTLLQKFTRSTEVSWTTLVDLLEPETYAEKVKSPPSTPSKSPVWFGSGVKPGSNQKEKMPATALAIGPQTPKAKKNSAPQQVLRQKRGTARAILHLVPQKWSSICGLLAELGTLFRVRIRPTLRVRLSAMEQIPERIPATGRHRDS